jgi:hypothetical protein
LGRSHVDEHTPIRRAMVDLPSRYAIPPSNPEPSRRKYTPAQCSAHRFLLKPRCARQVDQEWLLGRYKARERRRSRPQLHHSKVVTLADWCRWSASAQWSKNRSRQRQLAASSDMLTAQTASSSISSGMSVLQWCWWPLPASKGLRITLACIPEAYWVYYV